MTDFVKEGVKNKKKAVDGLEVPEIMRKDIRRETLLGGNNNNAISK